MILGKPVCLSNITSLSRYQYLELKLISCVMLALISSCGPFLHMQAAKQNFTPPLITADTKKKSILKLVEALQK
jgi:hypothetical protein